MSGRVLVHASGFIAFAFCAIPAVQADMHPLVNHAGAQLSGQVDIMAGSGHQFNVTIDYAVFTYGDFLSHGGAFTAFDSFAAPDTARYIYAYQIHSNGPSSGAASPSSADLSKLGVSLSNGAISSMGYDLGFDPGTDEINAVNAYAYDNSFLFTFLGKDANGNTIDNRLKPDQRSAVLLISSDSRRIAYEPVSILNGGLTGTAELPTPQMNPTPSPSLLLLIGVALLAGARPMMARVRTQAA